MHDVRSKHILSMLAEDAIKAAIKDYKSKQEQWSFLPSFFSQISYNDFTIAKNASSFVDTVQCTIYLINSFVVFATFDGTYSESIIELLS